MFVFCLFLQNLWWNQDSNPCVRETHSPADWMSAHKPIDLSRINLKRLDLDSASLSWASIQPTAVWLSHLALAIGMFAFVTFDALAQVSVFRIERRQHIPTYLLTYLPTYLPANLTAYLHVPTYIFVADMRWHRETHIYSRNWQRVCLTSVGFEPRTMCLVINPGIKVEPCW